MVYLLEMVIFHSYIKLPEGNHLQMKTFNHAMSDFPKVSTWKPHPLPGNNAAETLDQGT
jgi:hypothetical protein